MKHLLAILILAGLVFYLYFAYARFYNKIAASGPIISGTIVVTPNAPTTNTLNYQVLGDSLSAGVGVSKTEDTFPYHLAQKVATNKHVTVNLISLAQPGATSDDVLKKQTINPHLPHTAFTTVAIGINDLHNRVPLTTFRQNLTGIVASLANSTDQTIILTIPFLGSDDALWPPYRAYFDWQTRRYNAVIQAVAAAQHVTLVDLYAQTHAQAQTDRTYYSADGFHPSAIGYAFWGDQIYDALNF